MDEQTNFQRLNLTPEQKIHVDLMKSIACDLADLPLILKGGTALLLNYGLDRYSEDLDFDCNKHLNLSGRLEKAIKYPIILKNIHLPKDTQTGSRYKITYDSPIAKGKLLKIDLSFRANAFTSEWKMINGIRVYNLPVIIQQKFAAFENRTRARDLYDMGFLVKNYPDLCSSELLNRLNEHTTDIDQLEARFKKAFSTDPILNHVDPVDIIIQLQDNRDKAVRLKDHITPPLLESLKKIPWLEEPLKTELIQLGFRCGRL